MPHAPHLVRVGGIIILAWSARLHAESLVLGACETLMNGRSQFPTDE